MSRRVARDEPRMARPRLIPEWMLRRYRHLRAPLLVLGGTTSERAAVAEIFRQAGPLHAGPDVRVDCVRHAHDLRVALTGWLTSDLDDDALGLRGAERGTLVLDGVDRLDLATLRLLQAFVQRFLQPTGLDGTDRWGGRLVACASEDLLAAVERGTFPASLFDTLDKLRVDLGGHEVRGAA
jgi:DNA-binding NtrC family response regulator